MREIKPNYLNPGYSDRMSNHLKELVEQHLKEDLKNYNIKNEKIKFDWSESCIEGHSEQYLNSFVENLSNILVFDENDKYLAGGWMEFIIDGSFFIAYWEYISTWDNNKKLKEKTKKGIPSHIWKQIPDDLKSKYRKLKVDL